MDSNFKGLFDQFTRNVLASFRDCMLFPVPVGIDPQEVEPPQLTEVNTTAFRSRIATQNIAVALGHGDGLFAVQFDDEQAMAQFFNRNPTTRASLLTKHGDTPVLWLRCRTAHRVSLFLPSITLLMRGHLLIVDRRGPERSDFILNEAIPLMVNPESMNWGGHADGLVDCWLTRLSHGEFFRRNLRGQVIPNRRAWSNYLTRRLRPQLVFEMGERQFYEGVLEGGWRPVAEDLLRLQLRDLIVMAPVEATEAKARLSDEWLIQLCRGLKSSLAGHLAVVETRLRSFAAECLVKQPGANLTNAQLAEAFAEHCRQTGETSLSPKSFQLLIGRLLRGEPWGVCYSKSIQRPGGQQNGWRGLKLKHAIKPSSGDVGADGADGVKI